MLFRSVVAATPNSLRLRAPGVTTALRPDSLAYSIRPQNDPLTGVSSSAPTARDYGGFWGHAGAAYPFALTDATFAAEVNPSRNPLALPPSDPLFQIPSRFFYHPEDEVMPSERVQALERLWNSANPGNCVAVSSGDPTARHSTWGVSGPVLHERLESLRW